MCCPLVLAYLIIYKDHVELFADEEKFSDDMKREFAKNHVCSKTIYRNRKMRSEN